MSPREPETVTRKPDDDVGTPGTPPAGGGHQTGAQAAITDMDAGGRSDAERNAGWEAGAAGQSQPALGGSSAGHSDQKAARCPDTHRKVVGGLSQPEREEGA